MFSIVKRLRAAPETSAALHDAKREIDAALPSARAVLAEAEQERAGLLLTGDDRTVLASEAKIQAARISVDRLVAASGEAARRAAEAEAREACEALDAERTLAERRAATIAKRLLVDYEKFSGGLSELLHEVDGADAAASAVNSKLLSAGREDLVKPVEERVIPIGHLGVIRNVLRDSTSVLAIGRSPGWGAGAEIPKLRGFKL